MEISLNIFYKAIKKILFVFKGKTYEQIWNRMRQGWEQAINRDGQIQGR